MKRIIEFLIFCFAISAVLSSCRSIVDKPDIESPSPSPIVTASTTPSPTPKPTPTPSPAPTPVPIASPQPMSLSDSEIESLRNFLSAFRIYSIGRTYDWRDVLAYNGSDYGILEGITGTQPSKNILDGILCFPWCCDFDIYPGSLSRETMMNSSSPLTFPGKEIDWILENIFNCSSDDITQMRKMLSGRFSYDGDYHDSQGPLGFGLNYSMGKIIDVQRYEDYYFVRYEIDRMGASPDYNYPVPLFYQEQQAVLGFEQIDGSTYWTMYYCSAVPFIGKLPNGALIEEAVYPKSDRTPEPDATPVPTPEPTPAPTPLPVPGENDFPVTLEEARQIAKNYIAERYPDEDVQMKESGGYAHIGGNDYWGFYIAINYDGRWVIGKVFVNAQTGEITTY